MISTWINNTHMVRMRNDMTRDINQREKSLDPIRIAKGKERCKLV